MAFDEANYPPCSYCGCHGNSAGNSASAKRGSYSLPPRPPKKPNNSPTSPLPATSSATAALQPPRTPKKHNASPTSLFGFSKIAVPTTSSRSVPDPSLPPTFSSSCDGLQELHVQGGDGFETIMVDKHGEDLIIHLGAHVARDITLLCRWGRGKLFAGDDLRMRQVAWFLKKTREGKKTTNRIRATIFRTTMQLWFLFFCCLSPWSNNHTKCIDLSEFFIVNAFNIILGRLF